VENFDVPGEDEFGQTFYEKTETSNSACVEGSDSKCSNHREGTGVDLKEAASGVAIGWFQTDEWLEYSVYAEKAGDYTLYVAAVSEMGGTLKFTIKDAAGNLVSETGDIVVGESGGFNDSEYGKTEGVAVKLAEGVNVIRMTCTKEYLDVDYFNLVEGVNAADNALIGQEVPPTYISVAEVEAKENSSSSSSSEELQAGTSSSGKTEKTEAIFADRINMFSNTLLVRPTRQV